jgi:N-sulfoglucosamine sulfohydrolase
MMYTRFLMLKFLILGLVSSFLVGQLQAADSKATPNVLFCIADDASPTFGAYGYEWVRTPNIDRVASQGLVFENAYTPTSKCAPSRAAILTGRNPWQLEEGANHQSFFPANYKAFTEVLSDSSYFVGAQGKFWGPGSAITLDGKPRTWGLATSGGESAKNDGGAKFKKFLDDRPKDKPFFFWFGSTNPHRSYPLDSGVQAGKKTSDIGHVPKFWPDNDTVRRDMLDYAVEVELYDAQVGGVLDVLEASGEADNTLVIITSDHGMPFPRSKGHNYDISNRVPFVVRWPNGIVSPGRRIRDFVTLIAVAPTILNVMGIDTNKSGMAEMTGKSLVDLFNNQPSHDRSFAILGRERNDVRARPGTEAGLGYPIRGIRQDQWLYLRNFEPERWPCGNPELGLLDTDASPTKSLIENSGEKDAYWQFCFGKRPLEEFFDLSSDPDCVRNLADDPKVRETKEKLKEKLFAELKKQKDPRVLGEGAIFDNYPTAKKATAPKSAKAKK